MKIITITLAPAVDVEYAVRDIKTGLNRCVSQKISAGGKGINVARAVAECVRADCDAADAADIKDITEVVAVFPAGGATGKMICAALEAEGIPFRAVEIDGCTRVNTSVIPESGESVEINAPGTPIGRAAAEELERTVLGMAERGDVVAVCGSTPADLPKSYPAELCGRLRERGIVTVLDCDGEALRSAVSENCPAMLIKPNADELAELTGRRIDSYEDAMSAAEELLYRPGNGELTVITTMAGDGSVITRKSETGMIGADEMSDGADYADDTDDDPEDADCAEVESTFFETEKRPVVRLKGAGDTFLGAFLFAKYLRGGTNIQAMDYAGAVAGDYVSGE